MQTPLRQQSVLEGQVNKCLPELVILQVMEARLFLTVLYELA